MTYPHLGISGRHKCPQGISKNAEREVSKMPKGHLLLYINIKKFKEAYPQPITRTFLGLAGKRGNLT